MILNHRETKLMPRREREQSGTGIYHIMLRLTQHYIRYGKRCDSRVGSKTCPHDPLNPRRGDYYQGKGHPVSGGKVSIWEILVSLLTI